MNELVDLVVKKTGIPAATAQQVIGVVMDFLKQRLPAPIASQLDGLMSGGGTSQAGDMLGGIESMFGKK